MKTNRPTTISQVLEYDKAVNQLLLEMLKKRLAEKGIEMTFKKSKNVKPLQEPEDLQDFPYTLQSEEEQMEEYKRQLLEGKAPAMIDLPPLMFPESTNGVPFLTVTVVSYLSNTPQTLPHTLLSHVRQDERNVRQ